MASAGSGSPVGSGWASGFGCSVVAGWGLAIWWTMPTRHSSTSATVGATTGQTWPRASAAGASANRVPNEGFPGGKPSPRNESVDSCPIAPGIANSTAMATCPATAGSTCSRATCQRVAPIPIAAVIQSRERSEDSSTRMILANRLQWVSAMVATMAPGDGPSSAVTMIASSSVGTVSVISTKRIPTASKPRGPSPIATPITSPNAPEITAAFTPTKAELRMPRRVRATTSRPRWSVPSQCAPLGPWSRTARSVARSSGSRDAKINNAPTTAADISGVWDRVRGSAMTTPRVDESGQVVAQPARGDHDQCGAQAGREQ